MIKTGVSESIIKIFRFIALAGALRITYSRF